MQRASFDGPDPTLRTILAIIGVTHVPHHRFGGYGARVLHDRMGAPLGTYTAPALWKVITERAPEQSILGALKAAVVTEVTEEAA